MIRYADAHAVCPWCNARSETLVQAWDSTADDKLSGIYRCYNCNEPSVVTPLFEMRGPLRIPTFKIRTVMASEAKIARLHERLIEGYSAREKDIISCKW